ncbi:PAS domain-containing protein [Methylobacterium sp. J-068]|uniref:PAS domain-containing protein n=1 Tax=Methylobacterium sp. J-068 TaxID=2836649 RepID=UPI001FBA1781|nr:PAS domain-containing protein [Methylobacterium sp. J-068]MCJ2036100.1 PAS domain-containing protein [Methylobacterium sp. J-068]
MKHPTSRMLHSYWDRLRRARAAPERSEIEPGEIRNLLADSLILEIDMRRSAASVRLAGTHVCALFGRELRGRSFAELWGAPEADPWRLVEAVALDTVGVVAGLRGTTERAEVVDLELLLLPLRHHGETQSRVLGALSPACVPQWLGIRPVTRLQTTSMRILGHESAPRDAEATLRDLPEPANDTVPLRRGHLLVHPGGRV